MSLAPRTHRRIDPALCGAPVGLGPGTATVRLETTETMAADEHDLVHGGFVFSLADYAAMLAVNEPTVVLGSAESRFERPVRLGETLLAEARRMAQEGKKHTVAVTVRRQGEDDAVFTGTFVCFVPDAHVLAP